MSDGQMCPKATYGVSGSGASPSDHYHRCSDPQWASNAAEIIKAKDERIAELEAKVADLNGLCGELGEHV